MSTTVHCTCRVADYDRFRPGYDKALEVFGEHIRNWRLWRGQDDPNSIVVEEVFDSRELAEAIWTDPKTKAAMEADGIDMTTVQIQYLDEVGSG
jgi:quinol monooxygenase YgiN